MTEREEIELRYRGRKPRLYPIWVSMKSRCYNENNNDYKYYGGRGITVCDEWKQNYKTFEAWALGAGYDKFAPRGECTLDRIDNNGPYSPDNCRWVPMSEQGKNKREYTENREKSETIGKITIRGVEKSIPQWASETGISKSTLFSRWKKGKRGDQLIQKPRKSSPLPYRCKPGEKEIVIPAGMVSLPHRRKKDK